MIGIKSLIYGAANQTNSDSVEDIALNQHVQNLLDIADILNQFMEKRGDFRCLLKRVVEIRNQESLDVDKKTAPLYLAIAKVTMSLESFLKMNVNSAQHSNGQTTLSEEEKTIKGKCKAFLEKLAERTTI